MNEPEPHSWSSLPPPRDLPEPRRPIGPILVPLLIVAVLWLLDARRLAVVVLAVAVVLGIATARSPSLHDRITRAMAWIGDRVGRVLTFVLLGLVQLLIFTPVSILARLTRSSPLDRFSGRTDETRWLSRSARTRTLHHRQYADERYRRAAAGPSSVPGSPRWIRGLVGGVVLILAADIAVGSLLVRLDREDGPVVDGPVFGFDPAAQEALALQPRSAELMQELQQVGIGEIDPFLGWRFPDGVTHESELVSVTGGTRRTRSTDAPGPATEVWFFGGSTMYGSGQRDDATIPSVLVDTLGEDGIAVNATNFGHPAYANWQQVQLLTAELTAGTRPPPEVVVFYDGFNDLTLQTHFGVHRAPTHLFFGVPGEAMEGAASTVSVASTVRTWWADHSAVALAIGRVRNLFGDDPEIQIAEIDAAPIESIDPHEAADAAVAVHRRGIDHVVALSEAYGFDALFFWQPFLYTREPLTPAEEELVDLPGYDTDVWIPMTERVRSLLAEPVIDLSDALDGEPTPVFWDFVHTNERGAALVAEAMRPALVEALGS